MVMFHKLCTTAWSSAVHSVIVHRCRHDKAPRYLADCCTPVTDVVGRQRLRLATQQMMVVPRRRLSKNSQCKAPRSGTPCRTTSVHSRTMSPLDIAWEPGFSLATSVLSALETSWQMRYINSYHKTESVSVRHSVTHGGTRKQNFFVHIITMSTFKWQHDSVARFSLSAALNFVTSAALKPHFTSNSNDNVSQSKLPNKILWAISAANFNRLTMYLFSPIFGIVNVFPTNDIIRHANPQKAPPCMETHRLKHKVQKLVQQFDLGTGQRER